MEDVSLVVRISRSLNVERSMDSRTTKVTAYWGGAYCAVTLADEQVSLALAGGVLLHLYALVASIC